MKKLLKTADPRGFTLVEIIAVLIVVGILAAVIITRAMSTTSTTRVAQESVIKNHIRYAQALADETRNDSGGSNATARITGCSEPSIRIRRPTREPFRGRKM